MDRELAAIGRTAFARKMQVAEALSKDRAPGSVPPSQAVFVGSKEAGELELRNVGAVSIV